MSQYDKIYEIYRDGLLTTIKVKSQPYDLIEFTLAKNLTNENGKTIVDSSYTLFFTQREYKEFLQQFVNDMKAMFDNETVSK